MKLKENLPPRKGPKKQPKPRNSEIIPLALVSFSKPTNSHKQTDVSVFIPAKV